MEIWETQKLLLFVAFVIPGFISIKVYDLLVPAEIRDVSKSLIDAVAYSCVNYALLSWLIFLSVKFAWHKNNPIYYSIFILAVLFIFPILWALAFVWLRKTKVFLKRVPHPTSKPWDYVFSNGQSYWIVVELNDGSKIGGIYDTKSFASSFPADEQIYVEQIWKIGDEDQFISAIDRSHGAIISSKNIKSIRFYQ